MNERNRFEEEMSIIPMGWTITAILFASGIMFLMEGIVPRHHHALPHAPWWSIIATVAALLAAATILLTGYIWADAKRRGMNALLWVILIILIPKPIGFIAYFLLRKPMLQPCPNCHAALQPGFRFCPHCRYVVGPTCMHCGRAIELDYKVCPYCGQAVQQTPPTTTVPPPQPSPSS